MKTKFLKQACALALCGTLVFGNNIMSYASVKDNVGSMDTSVDSADGTGATADKILTGYAAWVEGELVKGNMPNNGALNKSNLTAGASYTIPAGYTTGGTVTAASLASQTGVDSGKTAVGAAQMLTGYQGWVNGSKISGSMANLNGDITEGTISEVTVDGEKCAKIMLNQTGKITKDSSYVQVPIETIKNQVSSLNSSLPNEFSLSWSTGTNIDGGTGNTVPIFVPLEYKYYKLTGSGRSFVVDGTTLSNTTIFKELPTRSDVIVTSTLWVTSGVNNAGTIIFSKTP